MVSLWTNGGRGFCQCPLAASAPSSPSTSEEGEGCRARRCTTDEWHAAYAARADRILTLLASAKLRVILCGNPIGRSATYSADMGYINDIYAAETMRFGAQFLPLWTAIADGEGRYAAYGKDRDGRTQRLRTDDGIHLTAAGYELIAEKLVGLMSAAAANSR